MSLYSGVIKEQAETINSLEELTKRYHNLSQELIDVLAQHIDVSSYERSIYPTLSLTRLFAVWRQFVRL